MRLTTTPLGHTAGGVVFCERRAMASEPIIATVGGEGPLLVIHG